MVLRRTERYGLVVALLAFMLLALAAPAGAVTYSQEQSISTSLGPAEIAYLPSGPGFVVRDSISNKAVNISMTGAIRSTSPALANARIAYNSHGGNIYLSGRGPGGDELDIFDTNFVPQYTTPYSIAAPQTLGAYYDPGIDTDVAVLGYLGMVQKISANTGTIVGSFTGPTNPVAIACAPDITTTSAQLAYILTSSAISIYDIDSGNFRATPVSGLSSANAIAVESTGPHHHLFVGDGTNVKIFSPSTSVQDQYSNAGTLTLPANVRGIAVDDSEKIYVTTQNSGLISVYSLRPGITGIDPHSGPTAGGTVVTITGYGFQNADSSDLSVYFGSTPATGFVVDSDTQITAVAPAGTAGTVYVSINSPYGTSRLDPDTDAYTYVAPPTVTSVSPTSGSTSGGTLVTITGSNFDDATGVRFGSNAAASYTIDSANQITARSPAGTGTVDVTVTTAGGTSAISPADRFRYAAAPAVTSVLSLMGPTTGGNQIVFYGTDFTGATSVTVDGIAATGLTVDSDTQITVTAPAHAAGQVHIRVTTPSGTSAATPADLYTYVNAPTVSAITPVSGPIAGGTTVTITGSDFTGPVAVTFGGVSASSVNVDSSTSITVTSPAHATGTVDIRVSTPGGTSATSPDDQFRYYGSPAVSSIAPPAGPLGGGTSVTISGSDLLGATAVSFGGTAATGFTVDSATQITAISPAGTGTADVRVTTPGGTSATGAADQFTWMPAPTVASISPTSGPAAGGTTVTIIGTGFTGATAVTFGSTAATDVIVNSPASLTATSPAGTGTVDVTVTAPGGISATGAADQFAYIPAPVVTGVSPASGQATGGDMVTITGTGFVTGATITFGGVASGAVTVDGPTSVTATTPAHAAGAVDVTVTNPDSQSGTRTNGFTYIAAPTVSGISPSAGTTAGGQPVTITGTGFMAGATVAFGGSYGTSLTVTSPATITVTTPAHAAGAVDVVVTNADSQSGTLTNGFTYTVPPTIVPTTAATTVPTTSTGHSSSGSGETLSDFPTSPANPPMTVTVNIGGDSKAWQAVVTGTGLRDLIVTGTVQQGPAENRTAPPGTVFQYMSLVPARYTSITKAVIHFTVPQSWLDQNHIDPKSIVLYHQTANGWQALPTTLVTPKDGNVFFSAQSTGFSLFAIAGTPTIAIPTITTVATFGSVGEEQATTPAIVPTVPVTTQTTAPPAPTPQPAAPSPLLNIVLVIAAIGIVAGGGFMARRR